MSNLEDWEPMSDEELALYVDISSHERKYYNHKESVLWQLAVDVQRSREANNNAAVEIVQLRVERDALRFDNAELLDGLERKHDYACRMDALAEERLMEITRLRAAINTFITEVDDDHQPEWASDQAKASGKEPWCCQWCGPQDGHWPCCHRMALDELKEARHER